MVVSRSPLWLVFSLALAVIACTDGAQPLSEENDAFQGNSRSKLLRETAASLASAIVRNDTARLYLFFDSDFRAACPYPDFQRWQRALLPRFSDPNSVDVLIRDLKVHGDTGRATVVLEANEKTFSLDSLFPGMRWVWKSEQWQLAGVSSQDCGTGNAT